MKILVVCQHYWPEPYYLPDVCEELARRGHEVHVVTDVPNYPMGETYDGYDHRKNREQERNGVRITRTFTIPRHHSAVFRLLNYYSYSFSSTAYIGTLPGDYDVVFANETSPVMMTRAATAYSRKWGKKCVLYCMDLWPACLAAGGLSPESPIYRFFGAVSRKLYNRADRILITSKMFREYLETEHGVPDEKIAYLPQYAPARFDEVPPAEEKDTYDLVFAGNVGAAQSLDTLLRAAALLQKETWDGKPLRWHIVGDGSELQNLKDLAARLELTGVIFHGRRPPEEMPRYYALADAMLVLLTADKNIARTLPGKVQTCMAAGKPILAAADGETPSVLEEANCGFCAPAENAAAFAEAVRTFLTDPDKARLGRNARAYYERHFTRQVFMDKLEEELMVYESADDQRGLRDPQHGAHMH